MRLPEPRDHRIALPEATEMTRRYRDSMPKGSIKGFYFHAEAFLALLRQADAAGIRIYLGRQADGSLNLVMAGVDKAGNDILPTGTALAGDDGTLMENSFPCPIFCGDGNGLNGEG